VGDVIRRADARIVLNMKNRDAQFSGAGEQGGALRQRWLDADQLHQAFAIGVLTVDHNQRRFG
jgi:hypothetical protein